MANEGLAFGPLPARTDGASEKHEGGPKVPPVGTASPFRIPDKAAPAAAASSPDAERPPSPPSATSSGKKSSDWRAALAKSQTAQLAAAGGLFAVGFAVYLWAGNRQSVPMEAREEAASSHFPKIGFLAQDAPATEAEVGDRLLAPAVAKGPRDGPTIPSWRMKTGNNARNVKGADEPRARRSANAARTVGYQQGAALAAPETGAPIAARSLPAGFFGSGSVIKAQGGDRGPAGPTFELGQRIAVVLLEGLSSAFPGVVLAQVVAPVEKDGRTLLRQGDVLKGRAQSDGERIFIEFFEAATSSAVLKLSGYATDGQFPGIVAQKRKGGTQERGRDRAIGGALDVARQAASGAAAAVSGSLPGQIVGGAANSVTGQALGDAQRNLNASDSTVLQLPRGKKFNIVITGA